MTTRRSFLSGLLASTLTPASAIALPVTNQAGFTGQQTYTLALVKSFRQTKEIVGANVFDAFTECQGFRPVSWRPTIDMS